MCGFGAGTGEYWIEGVWELGWRELFDGLLFLDGMEVW